MLTAKAKGGNRVVLFDDDGNEVEQGKTTFRDLVEHYGQGVRDGRLVKAFIPGGVSAPWFGPDQLDMPLSQEQVGAAGSMLGSGAVTVTG